MYRVEVEVKQAPFFLKWCRKNIDSAHYPERDKDKGFLAGKFAQWSDKQLRWLSLIVFRIAIATNKEVPRYSEARKFSDEIGKKLGSYQTDTVTSEPLRSKSDQSDKPKRTKRPSELKDKWNIFGLDLLNDDRLSRGHLRVLYVLYDKKWRGDPFTKASQNKLAILTRLDPSTVYRRTKELYDWGFYDKSGSAKGGRNQTMSYNNMMPYGQYRHGIAPAELVTIIESGINPASKKPFDERVTKMRHIGVDAGVTAGNYCVDAGVTGDKHLRARSSSRPLHSIRGAIVLEAVASGAARARQPVEPSAPFERGVARSASDRGREPEEEEEGHAEPYADDLDQEEVDPGQQGTAPDMQEDVSGQSAATRPVPRPTARPSVPRRDPPRWEPFFAKFYSDWDDCEFDSDEEYAKRDKRFCYEVLADKFKMNSDAVPASVARWYQRASLKRFVDEETALRDVHQWLRREFKRDF